MTASTHSQARNKRSMIHMVSKLWTTGHVPLSNTLCSCIWDCSGMLTPAGVLQAPYLAAHCTREYAIYEGRLRNFFRGFRFEAPKYRLMHGIQQPHQVLVRVLLPARVETAFHKPYQLGRPEQKKPSWRNRPSPTAESLAIATTSIDDSTATPSQEAGLCGGCQTGGREHALEAQERYRRNGHLKKEKARRRAAMILLTSDFYASL